MFLDFLIGVYQGLVEFLGTVLPATDTAALTIPAVVTNTMGNVFYYVDPTPIGVFVALIGTLFSGFLIYKGINILFSWIGG